MAIKLKASHKKPLSNSTNNFGQ